jgi:hypothetical protein
VTLPRGRRPRNTLRRRARRARLVQLPLAHDLAGDVRRYVDSQVRTLLHELAHAHDEFIALAPINSDEREPVAESAAYVIGAGLGLQMEGASTFYLTSWRANHERMGHVAEQVLDVARRIDDFLADLHESD